MRKAIVLVTGPATEPITAAEAKAHLRVDIAEDDALINALIVGARQMAEKITGRALLPQTWDLWLDQFPCAKRRQDLWFDGVRELPITVLNGGGAWIEIPKSPLVSITSLTTYDIGNNAAVFSASNYYVDNVSTPARLALNFAAVWPQVVLRPANGIQIRFVAGYADAAAVPQPIKQAILMMVADWYENRENIVEARLSTTIEFGTKALLKPYQVARL